MEEYIKYINSSKWLYSQLCFLAVYLPTNMISTFVFRSGIVGVIGFLALLVFLLNPFFAIDEPHYWWYMFTFAAAWGIQLVIDMVMSEKIISNGEAMIVYVLPMSGFVFALGISLVGRLLYTLI